MKKIFGLLTILILGYAGIFVLSRTLEKNQPSPDESFKDEELYFSANQLSLLGSDFKGLLADWYWIKSLQYLGDKVVNQQDNQGSGINVNDLRPLNPRLVYPMLDAASTLDPQFMTIYSYGASVLPAIDNDQAVKLLEKGIAANPNDWRLYHNLGYIYWRAGNYTKAAELYGSGMTKPGAPSWMKQMNATMQTQGGDRAFALQIYRQMFETAEDEQTKNFAELRYFQVQSLGERDAIRSILQNFVQKNSRCINDWQEISRDLKTAAASNKTLTLDSAGIPLDPTGERYVINRQNSKCDVTLAPSSKIPQN